MILKVKHLYPTNTQGDRVRVKFYGEVNNVRAVFPYSYKFISDLSMVKEVLKRLHIEIRCWVFVDREYIISIDACLGDNFIEEFKEAWREVIKCAR